MDRVNKEVNRICRKKKREWTRQQISHIEENLREIRTAEAYNEIQKVRKRIECANDNM